MFTEPVAQEVSAALKHRAATARDGYVFAKLLVATYPPENIPWLYLDLREAVRFIARRMERYDYGKNADRMFFDGGIIQFLVWRGG